MNREIEFHDSTLREIQVKGEDVVILLDKAYVHYSEGIPGLDKGTGWEQTISITLKGATVQKSPSNLPIDLDIGQVVLDGKALVNMLPLPARLQGEIEVALLTQYGEEFNAKAVGLETLELGPPEYVEDFPGVSESSS
jgi:hypothetical protein